MHITSSTRLAARLPFKRQASYSGHQAPPPFFNICVRASLLGRGRNLPNSDYPAAQRIQITISPKSSSFNSQYVTNSSEDPVTFFLLFLSLVVAQ